MIPKPSDEFEAEDIRANLKSLKGVPGPSGLQNYMEPEPKKWPLCTKMNGTSQLWLL